MTFPQYLLSFQKCLMERNYGTSRNEIRRFIFRRSDIFKAKFRDNLVNQTSKEFKSLGESNLCEKSKPYMYQHYQSLRVYLH